ncbi:hypothetical protein C8R45DRAFT_5653 [Mycena sanguinolenta]|nr:hypothetical protein C8R45DRAFT_5653 [Mycena sanguinolenta]
MSTRTRTRTASAAAATKSSKATPAKSKRSDDIENDRPKPAPKSKSSKQQRVKSPTPAVYCLCRKGDDGSPMVNCGECEEWFHFQCVGLSEKVAEDINVYICSSCSEKTGHRTVMLWEGPDAVEEVGKSTTTTKPAAPKMKKEKVAAEDEPEHQDSADDGPSSEDEYVAEKAKGTVTKVRSPTPIPPVPVPILALHSSHVVCSPADLSFQRRRARRLSFSDESGSSGSESEGGVPARSGGRGAQQQQSLKRKTVPSQKVQQAPAKRKKESPASAAAEDPARAFCLGKLEGVFRDIFLRYPHVRDSEGALVETKAEELSEEDKARVEDAAKQFATELEQCVYDIYSEPDKQGRPSAGGKYKDRFRMLQFNLSKVDRTVLHKRIASADITPREISLMSSTDLANEQAKQAIRIAEKEALEHSILEKTVIPRAKLTHKGLEDIEGLDANESNNSASQREREREEDQRRDRERAARVRQRTTSMSVPPDSPITPATPMSVGGPSWGSLARVPIHVPTTPLTEEMPSAVFGGEPMSAEPEMNLADLINIDDEPPAAQDGAVSAPPAPAPAPTLNLAPSSPIPGFGRSLSPEPAAVSSPTVPTGISPFASKPEASRTSSFDLNALWATPKKEEESKETSDAPGSPIVTTASPPPVPMEESQERKDEMMDLEETDDQDFDMFLEEKDNDNATPPNPEALQAAFSDLAQVWSGKINMPLDSTIPQETPVVARQIGGRTIEFGSPLWKTLFPTDLLRIDGRVPVDKSAQFLLQTRMNSSRELIAVAFSPASSDANAGFQILADFLIAKGRHGLVFPWGSRPKEHHPGKELYIIPLLSSDSLPDYMELLDNLTLPKIRNTNYLVGIWVLNKGKLAPPPPPPPPTIAPVPPSPNPAVMPQQPPPQFNLPAMPGVPAPQLTFEPSVLAAEVAALTPEQVRMMLQSLTASTLNAIPVANPIPPPQLQQPAMPPPQAWGHPPMPGPSPGPGPAMGMGMGYPPHYPPPPQQHGPPYGQQPSYDQRRDYNRDPHQGYDHSGRDNGWSRGRGRGRGRGGPGGGGGGGGGGPPSSPIDSGWPRRRDNGPSPPQRRWS